MNAKEFEMSLSSLNSLSTSDLEIIKELYGIETAAMVAYDQNNPHHCYDLWNHTIHTVGSLNTDTPITLKIAAFFHDIGKPVVAKEKDGRTVYYGHALKSAEIAKKLLQEMGYAEDMVAEICFYIRHHDDFVSWILPQEKRNHKNPFLKAITKKSIIKYINHVQFQENRSIGPKEWNSLLELCLADASAQADEVWQQGVLVDSKKHKLEKLSVIKALIHSIC